MLAKIGRSLHLSQYTLRDTYLTPVSLLADRDPLTFAREYSLDTDELNLLIHDKLRAQKVVKALLEEERTRERERTKVERIIKKRESGSVSGAARSAGSMPTPSRTSAPGKERAEPPVEPTPLSGEAPPEISKGDKKESVNETPRFGI